MVRVAILVAVVSSCVGFAILRRPAAIVVETDLVAALADTAAAARRGDPAASWLVVHVRRRDRAASAALDALLARDSGRAALQDGLGAERWRHVRVDVVPDTSAAAHPHAELIRLAGATTAVATLIVRGDELVGRLDGCPETAELHAFLVAAAAARPRFDQWAATLADRGRDDAAPAVVAARLAWIEQLLALHATDRAETALTSLLAPFASAAPAAPAGAATAPCPLPAELHRRALSLEIALLEQRGQLARAAAARADRDRRYPPAPSASGEDVPPAR